MQRRLTFRRGLLLAVAGTLGCYDFHLTGPEDPPQLPATKLVNVVVEYRQPAGCVNVAERCDDPIVFFGSWMRAGGEFRLQRDATGFLWRGTALGVPVNFPPTDEPYLVRIYDPHVVATTTSGFTASRLRVGSELLVSVDSAGTPAEAGRVYIDATGQGHNPL